MSQRKRVHLRVEICMKFFELVDWNKALLLYVYYLLKLRTFLNIKLLLLIRIFDIITETENFYIQVVLKRSFDINHV